MTHDHKENLDLKKVKIINVISFLIGLSSGLMSIIASSYFKEISASDNISFFYITIYLPCSLLNRSSRYSSAISTSTAQSNSRSVSLDFAQRKPALPPHKR